MKFKKLKMGQVWEEEKTIPVTLLELKEKEKDGKGFDFEKGEKLQISGKSKGKGFQGVVKRHGFAGGPKTHGQKHSLRAPGSIGAAGPQRVMPGTKMAGRMGMKRTTLKNVIVVGAVLEEKILILKGAVPGMRGSIIEVKKGE